MTGTAVAKRTPMSEVCETIASAEFSKKLAQALPPNVSVDRFTRVALTAIQTNPELITADRASLYNSVIRCAQDGLIPDGREAALVIFKSKKGVLVQYMPMIGGLRKVLAEHGFQLAANVVKENDTFDYQLGDEPFVKHKPPKLGKDRGDTIGAYAIIRDEQGRMVGDPEVMSRGEIEEIRKISRAATSEYGPWVNHYDEMCRKTVGRRAFKQAPLGPLTERQTAVMQAADAEFEFEQPPRMTEEEANLSASLAAQVPGEQRGPDDRDIEDAEFAPVDEGQESFEERAERAQRARAAQVAE